MTELRMEFSVSALEALPGYWSGRAKTRRQAATQLREAGNDHAADECLMRATEYEQTAAKLQRGW